MGWDGWSLGVGSWTGGRYGFRILYREERF